jgi:hypothetical protein
MEAEAMLVGPWKNFEELEESISVDELSLIVKAAHERETRHHRVMAALKGIKWDEGGSEQDHKTAFERAQLKADAIIAGISEEEMEEKKEVETLTSWGFKVEKE